MELAIQILEILKECIVSIAAIVTAVFAVRGINSWRAELKGKARFEVARELNRRAIAMRDAIRSCRSPMIVGSEFPEVEDGAEEPMVRFPKAKEYAYVLHNRFSHVLAAAQSFEETALEAEALWGSEARNACDKLTACAMRLRASIESYILNQAIDGEDFREDKPFARKIKSDVFATNLADQGELSTLIANAMATLEAFTAVHLKK